MKKSYLLGAVSVLFLVFSIPSHASIYTIDQRNDSLSIFQGYTTGSSIMGQSFSPTFNFLDHIELQINAQSPTGTTTVHVDIMDSPTGSILGSSDPLSFTTNTIQLGHFEFTPTDISAYSSLFISVVRDSGVGAAAFLAGGFGANSYAGGEAYSGNVTKPGFQNGSDLWFRTGDSAVPVPAAVWLFGSGLLGLVGMARRKKA